MSLNAKYFIRTRKLVEAIGHAKMPFHEMKLF